MDLTKRPIPGLIAGMAIPASVGMLFNTLYNVVDTFCAGLVSTEALAALGLSFPVFFVILALSRGVSTGATALIANELGRHQDDKARLYSLQSISFSFLFSLVLTTIGIFLSPFLFRILGASDEYLEISLSYMNIILLGTVFFMLSGTFNAILNSEGDTRTYRNFLVLGFFLNLVLNPAFMFGWLIFPAMGFHGIALSTVIIQFIGTVYLGSKIARDYLLRKDSIRLMMPRREYLDIMYQGLPSGLNMLTTALGIFSITYFVSYFGKESVAAYGIAIRIEQIGLMPLIGLNVATLSIVGQNNGAGLIDRVRETSRLVLKYGLALSALTAVVFFVFAAYFVGLFTGDAVVIRIGASYLRVAVFTGLAYVILGVNIATLQGLKKPLFGLLMGVYRQLFAPLIVYSLLTRFFALGVQSIWFGILGINWLGAVVAHAYTRKVLDQSK